MTPAALILLAGAGVAAPHAPAPTDSAPIRSPLEAECHPDDTHLLILGSYHMGNAGQDTWNLEADDVLAPKRQRDIADVLDRLARYAPPKVAIEGALVGSVWPERYRQYAKGEYTPGCNEIEQIAFRLAHRLGHAEIHPIDFPMWMDGRVPAEIGEAKPRPKKAGEVEPERGEPSGGGTTRTPATRRSGSRRRATSASRST